MDFPGQRTNLPPPRLMSLHCDKRLQMQAFLTAGAVWQWGKAVEREAGVCRATSWHQIKLTTPHESCSLQFSFWHWSLIQPFHLFFGIEPKLSATFKVTILHLQLPFHCLRQIWRAFVPSIRPLAMGGDSSMEPLSKIACPSQKLSW